MLVLNIWNFFFLLGPNPVLNVTPVIDSTNVTLEWPRPEGRIEFYSLKWWPVDNPEDIRFKNASESNEIAALGYDENIIHTERVLISDLMPGVEYSFSIFTVSYDLVSDISNLTTRTSKLKSKNFKFGLSVSIS